MTLWNVLPLAMRQKAPKSIRNALKAEIKPNEPANNVIPVMDPAPVLELDPDLLAAFLAEPDPEEIDLRPLVVPMATEDSILVNEGPATLLDDFHDEGSFSEVDGGHLGDGDNGFGDAVATMARNQIGERRLASHGNEAVARTTTRRGCWDFVCFTGSVKLTAIRFRFHGSKGFFGFSFFVYN